VLYQLIETPAAPALFAHLGRHGLWTRRFQDAPRRLRFGLPPDEAAWERLEAALGSF
jgi:cobalamin biosynthetic protein CobC